MKTVEEANANKTNSSVYLVCRTDNMSPTGILAGRFVKLKRNPENETVLFIDATTDESLWTTTSATVTKDVCSDTVILTIQTKNSEYRLIEIKPRLYQRIIS